jgi:parallel beta-helix repeat protein
MKKKEVFMMAFAIGLLIALSIPATVSASTTYDVYEGQSIQAGIDAASPGDTVFVHAGVYHQSVVIHTNEIILQGESGTILKGILKLTDNTATEIRSAWSPDGNRIAFSSDRDGNFEVYTMDSDGASVVRLTDNPARDFLVSPWSPSGNKLTFASDRDTDYEIYVMDDDGGNVQQLTHNTTYRDFTPSWSPDGNKIAFASDCDGNMEIYVMNPDGTNQTNITSNPASDYYPSWSPDSSQIVFYSDRDGDREIYIMDADGNNLTQVTDNEINDQWPSWSPDGNHIAFGSNRDGNWEIYMMNTDGSGQERLTNNWADDVTPLWSPDSSQIGFSSSRDSDREIYVMNVPREAAISLAPDVSGVTVEGFKIYDYRFGVLLEVGAINNVIYNNEVYGCWDGINLVDAQNNQVLDNYVTESGWGGIWLGPHYDEFGYILGEGSDFNLVSGNTVSHGGGIVLDYSSTNQVLNNELVNIVEGPGIFIGHEAQNNIASGNDIFGCNDGINLGNAQGNQIMGNIIVDSAFSGIHLRTDGTGFGPSDNVVYGNDIAGGDNGISLGNAQDNEVIDNDIESVGNGIWLGQDEWGNGSSENLIKGNNINVSNMGIRLDISHNNQIMDNEISNSNQYGVQIEGSNNNLLKDNQVVGAGTGFIIYESHNNQVKGNEVTDSTNFDIELILSDFNTIKDNIVTGGIGGIHLDSSNNNKLAGNYITDYTEGGGIYIEYSYHNKVTKNIMDSDMAGDQGGIDLWDAHMNQILQNKIYNCDIGIYLGESDENTINKNTVMNVVQRGIYVLLGSELNIISKNIVLGSGGVDLWDGSAPEPLDNLWRFNIYNSSNW